MTLPSRAHQVRNNHSSLLGHPQKDNRQNAGHLQAFLGVNNKMRGGKSCVFPKFHDFFSKSVSFYNDTTLRSEVNRPQSCIRKRRSQKVK